MTDRLFFIAKRGLHGKITFQTDALWVPVSARQQDYMGVVEAIELSEFAKTLTLDQLIAIYGTGELSKSPIYRAKHPAPVKVQNAKAAPHYREPRAVFATPIAAAWAVGKFLKGLVT